MTSSSTARSTLLRGALVLVGLVVLIYHASLYSPFLSDDALITLRYVDRLLEGHGLTWTDGERVEGYSNFLWLMATAAISAVGVDPIQAVRALGVICMAAVLAIFMLGFRDNLGRSVAASALAAALWVTAGPVAAWAIGGLEQPLVVALLCAAIAVALQLQAGANGRWASPALLGALLAGLCLTRPDGPLLAGIVGGWLLALQRQRWSRLRSVFLFPLLAVAGQLVFRLLYYGDWLPNTAYVKFVPSETHTRSGLEYVLEGLAALRPVGELSLVAFGLLLFSKRRRVALLLMPLGLAWLGYLIVIGGDIFPAWRHMLVALLIGCLLLQSLWDHLWVDRLPAVSARAGLIVVAVAAVVWFAWGQTQNEVNQAAKAETWEWDGEVVGRMLGRAFGDQQPLLALTASGAIPYWSKLPCLDLFGLNDRHIARNPPSDAGERWIGHGHGDPDYLLRRQPDLILWGMPEGTDPVRIYGEILPQRREFRENYTACRFEGSDPYVFQTKIYVDRRSPKVGIRQSPDRVEVPAYLMNVTGDAVARLDDRDRLVVTLEAAAPVAIDRLTLAEGSWRILEPPAPAQVRLMNPETRVVTGETRRGDVREIVVPAAGDYVVGLELASGAAVPVNRLVLQRVR